MPSQIIQILDRTQSSLLLARDGQQDRLPSQFLKLFLESTVITIEEEYNYEWARPSKAVASNKQKHSALDDQASEAELVLFGHAAEQTKSAHSDSKLSHVI